MGKNTTRPDVRRAITFAFSFLLALLWLPAQAQHAVTVIKSQNDDRAYQYLLLENQLQVLLISDPNADKAAAAVDVSVGAGHDPEQRQGLAHFLEHMLFLGTEKYPHPDEYQNYLSEHGGTNNAYTSLENTNYFFDVDPAYLEPALDRFAQFFIASTLDGEYVDRERNAVHSEYSARIKDDGRRTQDVYREILNPQHPITTFSVGNLTTLDNADGESLRRDLLAFYQQHYYAENLSLVVLGREPLEELKNWVVPRFSKVKSLSAQQDSENTQEKTSSASSNDIALIEPHRLPLRLQIKPEQELRYITLLFPTPSEEDYYREKPLNYLSNLLGDEGKGSLFALLKQLGWAEALFAGAYFANSNETFFQISIRVTPAGLQKESEIVSLTLEMIDRIKNRGIQEWRFNELKQLDEIAFQFQEKFNPIDTVSALAENLKHYPPQEALRGSYLMDRYDAELLQKYLARLNLQNLLLVVSAPEVETDTTSHFYQTSYKLDKLTETRASVEEELAAQLKLPPENEFIPKDLSLKAKPASGEDSIAKSSVPELIKDASRMRVWFKRDNQFNVPRASTYLRIKSPAAAESVRGSVLMNLYTALIRDSLNEFTYPASLAGLQYSLTANNRGLDLNLGGYNDGQDRLFQRVVAEMRSPRFKRERFDNIKLEYQLALQNASKRPPYVQIAGHLPNLLLQPLWTEAQQLTALEKIQFEDVEVFSKQVFVDAQADMLLHGNLTRPEAAKLSALVEIDLLGAMAGKKLAATKVLNIRNKEKSALATFAVDHNDSVVSLFIQSDGAAVVDQADAMLLQQVLSAAFFNELRTERQLGYVVFARNFQLKSVPGMQFLVQSPAASVEQLIYEIDAFAERFVARLPMDLTLHKQALITQLSEKPKSLGEQSAYYWNDIAMEHYSFDLQQQLIAAIEKLDDEEFNKHITQALSGHSKRVWLVSKALVPAQQQEGEIADPKTADDQTNSENEDGAAADIQAVLNGIEPVRSWALYWERMEKYEFP